MQRFKKIFAAITLTMVLAYSALAGEMPGGIVAPPDPPQRGQTTQQSTNSSPALDPVVEAALNLLQSLLALI